VALTAFQRAVCRLLADQRRASGDSYVAGGTALNALIPAGILEHASRSTHYAASGVLALLFEGEPPDPAALSRRWHAMLAEARDVVEALPPPEVGRCVLDPDAGLFAGGVTELRESLGAGRLVFHSGRIRGALPRVKSTD
jgi:hypothetical protein